MIRWFLAFIVLFFCVNELVGEEKVPDNQLYIRVFSGIPGALTGVDYPVGYSYTVNGPMVEMESLNGDLSSVAIDSDQIGAIENALDGFRLIEFSEIVRVEKFGEHVPGGNAVRIDYIYYDGKRRTIETLIVYDGKKAPENVNALLDVFRGLSAESALPISKEGKNKGEEPEKGQSNP
jgi:hypothetical protein